MLRSPTVRCSACAWKWGGEASWRGFVVVTYGNFLTQATFDFKKQKLKAVELNKKRRQISSAQECIVSSPLPTHTHTPAAQSKPAPPPPRGCKSFPFSCSKFLFLGGSTKKRERWEPTLAGDRHRPLKAMFMLVQQDWGHISRETVVHRQKRALQPWWQKGKKHTLGLTERKSVTDSRYTNPRKAQICLELADFRSVWPAKDLSHTLPCTFPVFLFVCFKFFYLMEEKNLKPKRPPRGARVCILSFLCINVTSQFCL